jgi:hypothetical protein
LSSFRGNEIIIVYEACLICTACVSIISAEGKANCYKGPAGYLEDMNTSYQLTKKLAYQQLTKEEMHRYGYGREVSSSNGVMQSRFPVMI